MSEPSGVEARVKQKRTTGTTWRQRLALRSHNKATGANKPLDERFAGMSERPSVYRRTTE